MSNKTQPWFGAARRLSDRGADGLGLVVDKDGVTLGPDFPLVRKTLRGYEPATPKELSCLREVVSLRASDTPRLVRHLEAIAKALTTGDIAKARILGLYFPINRLTPGQMNRLKKGVTVLKQFNPDEPRDERGRWTTDGQSRTVAREGAEAPRPTPSYPGLRRIQELLLGDPEVFLKPFLEEQNPLVDGEIGRPVAGAPEPSVEDGPRPPIESEPKPEDEEPPFVPSWRKQKPLTYQQCLDATVSRPVWLGFCKDLEKAPQFELDPRRQQYVDDCRQALLESQQYKRGICANIFLGGPIANVE